jgi:hypothetical protein
MGTYTNFKFDATLKKDLPQKVLDYIRSRLDKELPFVEEKFDNHPFFYCYRWNWVLTWHDCNSNGLKAWCKDTDEGLVIHIDTELKNYCESIEWFLIWIAPLVNLDHKCTRYTQVEGCDYDAEDEDCSELIRKIQERVVVNPEQIDVKEPIITDLRGY